MVLRRSARCLRSAALSPIPDEKVREMFPGEQIAAWPEGYRPTPSVAYYMYPKGVPLGEMIDARASIAHDERNMLQRAFAADYNLWVRTEFEQFAMTASDQRRRALRKILTRNRLPSEATVLEGLGLKPRPSEFRFTSYATMQDKAMKKLENCTSLNDRLKFRTFPEIRNMLYISTDSQNAARFIETKTREEIFYTKEAVYELAMELREKYDAMDEASRKRPILTMFGRGRLAHELNESCILPTKVIAILPPTYPLRSVVLPNHIGETPPSFYTEFSVQDMTVEASLAKFEPSMVVMEPHSERDYTAEVRGFHSTREVYMLGQLDSPAWGSFSFPWLSHGVGPGHDTFWMFGDNLKKLVPPVRPGVKPADQNKGFMPMDPPYQMQGYEKEFVDHVSRHLIGANDSDEHPYQYRLARYHRKEAPKSFKELNEEEKRASE